MLKKSFLTRSAERTREQGGGDEGWQEIEV